MSLGTLLPFSKEGSLLGGNEGDELDFSLRVVTGAMLGLTLEDSEGRPVGAFEETEGKSVRFVVGNCEGKMLGDALGMELGVSNITKDGVCEVKEVGFALCKIEDFVEGLAEGFFLKQLNSRAIGSPGVTLFFPVELVRRRGTIAWISTSPKHFSSATFKAPVDKL
jgi:hypothetical protein